MTTQLFHYTSINNLALILKSKSIRFGRLDYVNDPTEGESTDFPSLAHYLFVSCWTKQEEENIALWQMYTPQMRGVRIELPLPIFPSYQIGNDKDILVDENEYVDEKNNLLILSGPNKPEDIEYTDDPLKLKPKIRAADGISINSLGRCKSRLWAFEEECRYRLTIVPTDPNVFSSHFPDRYMDLVGKVPPSIAGYLRPIENRSFIAMKIRTSPKLLAGDKEMLEALVAAFNPSAVLESSTLLGRIR